MRSSREGKRATTTRWTEPKSQNDDKKKLRQIESTHKKDIDVFSFSFASINSISPFFFRSFRAHRTTVRGEGGGEGRGGEVLSWKRSYLNQPPATSPGRACGWHQKERTQQATLISLRKEKKDAGRRRTTASTNKLPRILLPHCCHTHKEPKAHTEATTIVPLRSSS